MGIRGLARLAGAGGIALLAGLGAGAAGAEEFDFSTGVDIMLRQQTTVHALQFLTVTKEIGGGFHLGQSVYSAAWGDAGGLFIGGFEGFRRFTFSDTTSVDIGGFVGGGGGAAVVLGDGLMTKAQVTLNQAFAEGFEARLGIGWTRVTGSAINTPVLSFGLSRRLDVALAPGHTGPRPASGIELSSAAGLARAYVPIASTRRGGGSTLKPMGLVGGEFTMRTPGIDNVEAYVSAVGAAYNEGAGYAEWLAGPRFYTRPFLNERLRGFADVGIGFAGGGTVDTGGGLVLAASAGVDARLFAGFHAAAGVMAITAPTGDFTAPAVFVKGALRFDDPEANVTGVDGGPARHWRFSTGLSYQASHPGFRPPGHRFTGSDPVLIETGADLFFGDRFYVNGSAYTVVSGNAGGLAMGTVGLGYELPIGQRLAFDAELFTGAAAGGGIATGGGLIYGAKGEIDYKVNDSLTLSLGAGKWASLGTASPTTLHAGIKIPLTTFHGR